VTVVALGAAETPKYVKQGCNELLRKGNVESAKKRKTYLSVAGISEGLSEFCTLISGVVE
jgi:hypothetical protein